MRETTVKTLSRFAGAIGALILFDFASLFAAAGLDLGTTDTGLWVTLFTLILSGGWLIWVSLGPDVPNRPALTTLLLLGQILLSFFVVAVLSLLQQPWSF